MGGAGFAEGADAFGVVGGAVGAGEHFGGEDAGGLPGHFAGFLDEIEAAAEGFLGDGGEVGGGMGGAVVEFEGGADFVDEAEFAGFGGGEEAAGQGEFDGAAFAHGEGEGAEGDEGEGAVADFGEAELDALGGDDDVGVGEEAEAGGEAGALDGGDDGFMVVEAEGEELFVEGLGVEGFGEEGVGEVEAGAEDGAFGVEEDGADGAVFAGVGEDGEEVAAEGFVEGVFVVGAVEGEAEDAFFVADQKRGHDATSVRDGGRGGEMEWG